MQNLLCDHEKNYCENKAAKFFRTGVGELVVSSPHRTFRKHIDDLEESVNVFRNRGVKDDEQFRYIMNNSLVKPVVSDIEDEEWAGKYGIHWS